MKASFYGSYAARSLARGGQRTLLAIFCIAVGVLAIVSLQLVGTMLNEGLTGNMRAANGGDLAISSSFTPLTNKDLQIFQHLKTQGYLTNYTAISREGGETTDAEGLSHFYGVWAVDPASFPLAGAPEFVAPGNGSLSKLLMGMDVVVTQSLLKDLGVNMGDTVTVHMTGRTFTARVTGVIKNTALFYSEDMLISWQSFAALPATTVQPPGYQTIYADVPGHTDANAETAKQQIQQVLPLAQVTTTQDALQQNRSQVQQVRYFLQIVGLLALLIGGIGIVNTMQVLLRRRQLEIAILKTTGYRRRDLYILFGVEAGLLGLIGGVLGTTAGIGVSFLVKGLAEAVFSITLPGTIDPFAALTGVGIGVFTAVIFGVLPIVQASQIRPITALRGLGERTPGGILLTCLLGLMLAALFFVLALGILGNVLVTLGAVGGGGLLLLLLGLGFALVALLIGTLPVPETFSARHVLLVGAALLMSVLLIVALPAFGVLGLSVSLLGVLVVLLPGRWKVTIKMALRNIGRQKARTSTTLVALFVGVFAIGLILTLGQNIQSALYQALSSATAYNSFIWATSADKAAVDRELPRIAGIKKQAVNPTADTTPVALNGVPIAQILTRQHGSANALAELQGVTGYDLAQGQFPTASLVRGDHDREAGRNLQRRDAGTTSALVAQSLSLAPFNLKLGDQITLSGQDGKTTVTLTIVGFYMPSFGDVGPPVLADASLVNTLAGGHPLYLYSLALDPTQSDAVLHQIQRVVPSVGVVSFGQLVLSYTRLFSNLVILLTAVASLAMLAGLIIIANAVALAMLERRRELGILKAVGFTSKRILGEVALENGVIGFTGAVLAMLLVVLALGVLANVLFQVQMRLSVGLLLGVVAAVSALCIGIAGMVAWGATRVRPLEVLRYE
jgi:putative ABC transport system permease protein